MKKLLVASALILALLIPALSIATDGSATITPSNLTVLSQTQRKVLSIAVLSGTSGAFTSITISSTTYAITGWYLYSVETIPGTGTAPGDVYTVTISDSNGYDLTAGLLAARSATVKQMVNIGNAPHGYPVIRGNLTLAIDTLTTTAATTTIILTFVAN